MSELISILSSILLKEQIELEPRAEIFFLPGLWQSDCQELLSKIVQENTNATPIVVIACLSAEEQHQIELEGVIGLKVISKISIVIELMTVLQLSMIPMGLSVNKDTGDTEFKVISVASSPKSLEKIHASAIFSEAIRNHEAGDYTAAARG